MKGTQASIALLVVTLLAGNFSWASQPHLEASGRECLAHKLSGRTDEVSLEKRDAFALMDAHTGRVLWYRHPEVLAQRSYQPGSILKVISAYVALARGKVDLSRTYRCRGGDSLVGPPGQEVRCWLRAGHGRVNLAKALALSCNLYFADLGTRMGAGSLLAGARDFGLGRSTNSDLPGEIPGSLPPAPIAGQAARLAVGQGDLVAVTPLQVLSLAGALANGGLLLSPRVSDPAGGMTAPRGELTDGAALRFIQSSMEEASTFGTGSAQKLHELRLAGKTGTAAWRKGWRTHAWFMGFAPMRTPLVALVVFVHDGQGSKEGAALARKVMELAYQEMNTCGLLPAKR